MKLNLIVLLALMCSLGTTAQATTYTFATLDIPGMITSPSGINGLGHVTGSFDDVDFLFPTSGFLYISPTEYSSFVYSAEASYTYATGINNSDNVVGYYGLSDGHDYGFTYSGGTITPFVSPFLDTVLNGINNIGDIVGSFQNGGSSGSFRYQASTSQFFTFVVPGATNTTAYGINNSGLIVGTYTDGTGNHGFTTYDGTDFTTVDVVGALATFATGINDSGQITGQYRDGTGWHGFVLDGNVLSSIDVPDAFYTYAVGINNAGQVVGSYDGADGTHGFLATPDLGGVPEPGAFVLLGTGILALAGWRRTRCRPA